MRHQCGNRSGHRIYPWLWVVALWSSIVCVDATNAEDDIDFFERKIRPVLVAHCYECHAAKRRSSVVVCYLTVVRVYDRAAKSGPSITAGNPDASLLIKAVRYKDDASNMPPKGKLC